MSVNQDPRLPSRRAMRYRASMKYCVLFTIILLALGAAVARAQSGADEQYVAIFSLIEQADALAGGGQTQPALAEYRAALVELQKFARIYPEWSPNIVTFREQYLADKISGIASPMPTATAPPPENSPALTASPPPSAVPASTAALVTVPTPASDAALTVQVADLQTQLQNLQAGNATLEVKLQEALAARPAAVDPRELVSAQEQVRTLMKENDLLRVSLETSHSPASAASLLVESNALAQARHSLEDMGKKLALATTQASELRMENLALKDQTKTLLASQEGVQALREENEVLKRQLAEAKASGTNSPTDTQVQADLAQAREQIETLKAAARQNDADKAALVARLAELEVTPAHPAAAPALSASPAPVRLEAPLLVPAAEPPASALQATLAEDAVRIHVLEQERDLLRVQLLAARQLWGGNESRAATNALVAHLAEQLKMLQTRLSVVEAQRVPYASEEMALFRQPVPEPRPAAPAAGPVREPPTGLMASADGYFSAQQYDRATGDYKRILDHDQNNGLALANLAAIELAEGHLPSAEKHILAAVSLNPDDAYNLSLLGHLRLEQQNYDAALDTLGRAAKLDPQNADIQVWLGITLGHLGLRLAAETALRQALVLDPNNAEAQNNLAVIYISEKPPRAELARWHYLKALAAGQPHNPWLEKLLADHGAAIPAP